MSANPENGRCFASESDRDRSACIGKPKKRWPWAVLTIVACACWAVGGWAQTPEGENRSSRAERAQAEPSAVSSNVEKTSAATEAETETGGKWGLAVLILGFLLLTTLAMRGYSIFVAAPFSALLVLVFSGVDPLAGMLGGPGTPSSFMSGFAEYLRSFYLIFALGAAFGKLLAASGAAGSIAQGITRGLGPRWACLAVVLSCAVLTYGGVSLFVVGFAVYPLAIPLFQAAQLPRRFIPAAIAFGSLTFTMTSAGSPEIQNLIPIKYLVDSATNEPLTDARAGWPVSLIVAVFMFVVGQIYLEWAIRRDVRRGGRFESRPGDDSLLGDHAARGGESPGLVRSLLPLLVTLLALNLFPRLFHWLAEAWSESADGNLDRNPVWRFLAGFPEDATLAIFLGVLTAVILLRPSLPLVWRPLGEGFSDGLMAIGSTCSVVGFGAALKNAPAFHATIDWVTNLPGDPLIGAAVAVAVICGLAGSASGGQGLAWPTIKEIYIDRLGVPPRALHRVVAISSGTLDTLPANGYLVMLIRNICGETHARSYWPILITCTILPAFGTALAVALFKLVPAWGYM